MIQPEEWRPVMNYEGYYEVSTLGRVRSLSRPVKCRGGKMRTLPGRTLSPTFVNGYLVVTLCFEGDKRNHMVSRLIATAFVRRPKELRGVNAEVSFLDGDVANVKPRNLRWVPRFSGATRTMEAVHERRRAA